MYFRVNGKVQVTSPSPQKENHELLRFPSKIEIPVVTISLGEMKMFILTVTSEYI